MERWKQLPVQEVPGLGLCLGTAASLPSTSDKSVFSLVLIKLINSRSLREGCSQHPQMQENHDSLGKVPGKVIKEETEGKALQFWWNYYSLNLLASTLYQEEHGVVEITRNQTFVDKQTMQIAIWCTWASCFPSLRQSFCIYKVRVLIYDLWILTALTFLVPFWSRRIHLCCHRRCLWKGFRTIVEPIQHHCWQKLWWVWFSGLPRAPAKDCEPNSWGSWTTAWQ